MASSFSSLFFPRLRDLSITLLTVAVPPRIVGGEGPRELVVRESTEVRLECRAEGYPEPYVMWRREDGKDMNYNGDVGMAALALSIT